LDQGEILTEASKIIVLQFDVDSTFIPGEKYFFGVL